MKVLRISIFLGLGMLLANGVMAQKVTTDYQRDIDFGRYKTFTWIKEPKTDSPLTRQRVVEDINATLTAKGLTLVTSDADLTIAAHAARRNEQTLYTFYDGWGGGWRWGGRFGSATTTVARYEIGTLVIDVFDARTKEAIWRGTSSKTLSGNPEKNAKSLKKAIVKMFEHFPPAHERTER